MNLYLRSASDFKIIDQGNNVMSARRAKEIIASGKCKNMNLALERLISFGWDIKKLKNYYKKENLENNAE